MPKITVNGNFPAGAKALRGGGDEDKSWRLWLDLYMEPGQLEQLVELGGKPLRITLED